MAVVFISPKERQRVFFIGITIVFVLFLIVISFVVFLSKPKEVLPVLVFNKPKINIDMNILDSEQFRNLQPFIEMQTQYSYKAVTKDKKSKSGSITAVSIDQAKADLESMGLTVTEIKQVEVGRDNPFVPYYTVTVAPSTGTKTTKK